ncbi:MAG: hypothetical protein UHJ46_07030 [Treponema sp.]|nr:hypothetical protein [Treponema sp.]
MLHNIFKNYLFSNGVKPDNIISVELDLLCDIRYRNLIMKK